tara:strand:- start:180 stop:605 length:426 start_codon:yes stop_codon:yes gene_type:complete
MAKLGATAGWSDNYCHDLTATNTLATGDSGKIFFLNSGTEFTTNLPACSNNAGYSATFVVKAAPSGANYVVECAGTDTIVGSISAGAASDVADTSSSGTQINFVDSEAVAGDWIKLICDGSNWYIVGGLGKVAAGITITAP